MHCQWDWTSHVGIWVLDRSIRVGIPLFEVDKSNTTENRYYKCSYCLPKFTRFRPLYVYLKIWKQILKPGRRYLSSWMLWSLKRVQGKVTKLSDDRMNSEKCEFHGTKLLAITGKSNPYVRISDGYNLYFNTTGTYDVTDYISGMLPDLLVTLAKYCNFTYEVHYRKDQVWGTIKENETVVSTTGVFDSLLNGPFDMLLNVLTQTPIRAKYLHLLHASASDSYAIGNVHQIHFYDDFVG